MYPVLFEWGFFRVYSYGLMLSIGVIVGLLAARAEFRRDGRNPELLLDFALVAVLVGVVGSRLLYVLLDWPLYAANPISILYLREGGLSVHGAILGGLAVAVWFARRHRIPFWKFADYFAPALALGIGVARLGCFFNGCCYGKPTNGFWGVLTRYAPGLHHPTQLYEMALALALFAGLWSFRRRKSFDGQLFLLFVIGYSVIRFILDYWRDEVRQALSFLTITQLFSLVAIAGAVVLMVVLRRTQVNNQGTVNR